MSNPNAPVIEFRSNASPFAVQSSFALTGSGFSGAIIAGTSSNELVLRIYNNFAGAAGIHDALECTLTSYDDDTHQGASVTAPVLQTWLRIAVRNYDGDSANGDGTTFYAVGGITKHSVPVHSGIIAGAAPHYIQVAIKVVVPAFATATSVMQGLWLEYSYV